MKLVYFSQLAALPTAANIQLLNQGIAVEVKSSTNRYFDETILLLVQGLPKKHALSLKSALYIDHFQ